MLTEGVVLFSLTVFTSVARVAEACVTFALYGSVSVSHTECG